MRKPILLTVDDDASVLAAIARDLRKRYAETYRIVRSNDPKQALDVARKMAEDREPLALALVDQRMPGLEGDALLAEIKALHPDSKRALLTAYADTEAAIRAINEAQIHHYLQKPWDPPEERLYPVLDDLLDDWLANWRPPFEGVRIVGTSMAPESYRLRAFFGGQQIPFQWLEAGTDPDAERRIAELGVQDPCLPLVVLPSGEAIERPSSEQLAEKLGLNTQPKSDYYDLAIVGAGPAGLAAAVYGASEGLTTVLIERDAPGGQAGTSSRIENYLGFPSGLSGADLARRALTQAQRFGVELVSAQEVVGLTASEGLKSIRLSGGRTVTSRSAIVATGVQYRKLSQPGVERLTGAGVYYGSANTEAFACKDGDVFVVGGANSAGQAAVYLSAFAKSVTILVRSEGLEKSMSSYLIDQIDALPNVHVRPFTEVQEVRGDDHLETVVTKHRDGETREERARALFVFIGAQPRTEWLSDEVLRDERGFVIAGPDIRRTDHGRKLWNLDRDPFLLETTMPGTFVAGDVRSGSVKRVASGVGEGSIAVQFVHRYLARGDV